MVQQPEREKTRVHHSDKEHAKVNPALEATVLPPQIGGYELLEKLGEGEFSVVYKAKHREPTVDSLVAIKVLKSRDGKKDLKLLENEKKILERLHHRAFPRWKELHLLGKDPYIVMEYVPGKNLREWLEMGLIGRDKAIRLAYDIVEAFRYLHSQGIVHRDIKPSHIQILSLEKREHSVRILDFGISILRPKGFPDNTAGAFAYLSPEETEGKGGTFASDIYSLGVVLYELIAGIYPYDIFEIENTFDSWKKVHRTSPPRPLFRKNLSPTLAEMLLQCLKKKPEERPNANQILGVLEKEITGLGLPSYVGILGIRGSGKTCYLTSLYGYTRPVTEETRKVLEEKYLDLIENGVLPHATALASYQLQFMIDTPTRSYEIVTKDYGGELLAGRIEELRGKEKRKDEDFQAKRAEIYDFFQNARAIVILVETLPAQSDSYSMLNYREQIYSLTDRLARFAQGKRKIDLPIVLALTKWDRMMQDEENPDPAVEKKRALEYIKKNEWLNRLYEDLQNLCPAFEVFPVSSFRGDQPVPRNVRPFNLIAPLAWAADRGEKSLWERYRTFEKKYEEEYRQILENYWRLLYVEKIVDDKICEEVEETLARYSKKYFQKIDSMAQKSSLSVIAEQALYREFLSTKGIQKTEKELAEGRLMKLEGTITNRKRIFVGFLFSLFLYAAWEVVADYRINKALLHFQQGQFTQQVFLQKLQDYRRWKWLGVLRSFREGAIWQKAEESMRLRLPLEKLAIECEAWETGWEKTLEQKKSYRALEDYGKSLLAQIQGTYLQKAHEPLLIIVQEKILSLRKKDKREYEEIRDLIHQWKFLDAQKSWQKYRKSKEHHKIMSSALQEYENNFTATVDAEVFLQPSVGFKDEYAGPEFILKATGGKIFRTPKNMSQRESLGKISFSLNLKNPVELNFSLEEIDSVRNDRLGTIQWEDIRKLLDNELLTKEHACGSQGTVILTLEPSEIKPQENFPDFEE